MYISELQLKWQEYNWMRQYAFDMLSLDNTAMNKIAPLFLLFSTGV